jgi:molybdopterin converting factor small subunit
VTESSLTVHVHYYSILADYASAKDADLAVTAGITVAQLLAHLLEVNPPAFKNIMMNGAERSSFVRIFRNGDLLAAGGEGAPVADGDEYRLFPAISGG